MADLGGAPGTHPPTAQNFLNFMQFFTKFQWRHTPLGKFGDPPGNLETPLPQKFGGPPGTRSNPSPHENLEEPPGTRPPQNLEKPPPPKKFGGIPPCEQNE